MKTPMGLSHTSGGHQLGSPQSGPAGAKVVHVASFIPHPRIQQRFMAGSLMATAMQNNWGNAGTFAVFAWARRVASE